MKMKAIQKFKTAIARRAAERGVIKKPGSASSDGSAEKPLDPVEAKAMAEEVEALVEERRKHIKERESTDPWMKGIQTSNDQGEGEPLFLGIGAGSKDPFQTDESTPDVMSDSPTAVDFNVYDRAYQAEVQRIMARPAQQPTVYLTRFVKEREHQRTNQSAAPSSDTSEEDTQTEEQTPQKQEHQQPQPQKPQKPEKQHQQPPPPPPSGRFADLVKKTMVG
jgi:calcium/calmodulin-dependent protein kinase kinase 2